MLLEVVLGSFRSGTGGGDGLRPPAVVAVAVVATVAESSDDMTLSLNALEAGAEDFQLLTRRPDARRPRPKRRTTEGDDEEEDDEYVVSGPSNSAAEEAGSFDSVVEASTFASKKGAMMIRARGVRSWFAY